MSLIVAGTKISGLGLATTAVAKQYAHLVREFPEIRGVHQWGTLNLQLEYPLRILNPDYTTSEIEWDPGFKERFSLTRIDIEPGTPGARPQPAWIYVAHRSPHRANTLFIELPHRDASGEERRPVAGPPSELPVLILHRVVKTPRTAHAIRGEFSCGEGSYLAATTMISTLYCGEASLASTVARAGVLPADTQPSQTLFMSAKVFMSVM